MKPRFSGPETTSVIDKKIDEGRGIGHGIDYKPWIRVGEFKNRGESRIVPGLTAPKRSYHLFSTIEYRMYLYAEYLKEIVDIREQFPILPLSETLDIANKLRIKHPAIGGHPKVITIDFLFTIDKGDKTFLAARSIKSKSELSDKRTNELLELEKQVCIERNYPWTLATEDQLTPTLEKNLIFLSLWIKEGRPVPTDDFVNEFISTLLSIDLSITLKEILHAVSQRLKIKYTFAVWMFRYLAWNHHIQVDIHSPIELPKPHLGLLNNQKTNAS